MSISMRVGLRAIRQVGGQLRSRCVVNGARCTATLQAAVSSPASVLHVPHLHDLIGDSSQPGLLGGFGVKAVAFRDVDRGVVIFREKGEIIPSPSMHSIQVGVDRHCQIDGEGRFAAHSFSPNCAVVISPLETTPIKFVALRSIQKGEELSFNYTTTEWELENGGFVDATTAQPVRGFKHLPEEQKQQLLAAGLLPAHIMQLWLTEVLCHGPEA